MIAAVQKCGCCEFPQWRLVPVLIGVVASVMGVALGIIWEMKMLAILSGVGGSACLFSAYVVYLYPTLKPLGECAKTYKEENTKLKSEREHFELENEKFKERIEKLEKIESQLTTEINRSSRENDRLTTCVGNLEKNEKKMEETLKQHEAYEALHQKQVGELNQNLELLMKGICTDHRSLSTVVETLSQQEKEFRKEKDEFLAGVKEGKNEVKENQQFLDGFIGQLKGVCVGIEAWKSDEALTKRIDLLQSLNKQVEELNQFLKQYEGEKIRLGGEIESLKLVKQELLTTIGEFKKEIGTFHQENEQLKKTARSIQGAASMMITN